MKIWLGIAALLASGASGAQQVAITSDHMLSQEGVTEFSGAVRLTGDNLDVEADTLRINANAQNYLTTGKPVRLRLNRQTVPTALSSNRLEYDHARQFVTLSGQINITHGALRLSAQSASYDISNDRVQANDDVTISTEQYQGQGATLDISNLTKEARLILYGNATPAQLRVVAKQQELNATAAQIEYDQINGTVLLRGDAVAQTNNETIKGEAIRYNINLQSFVATPESGGRVQAIIQTPDL